MRKWKMPAMNNAKTSRRLGRTQSISLDEMIREMVDADIERVKCEPADVVAPNR